MMIAVNKIHTQNRFCEEFCEKSSPCSMSKLDRIGEVVGTFAGVGDIEGELAQVTKQHVLSH